MKSLAKKVTSVLFDLRVMVGLGGAILGIVLHELFHVIMHWNDIKEFGIFPDRHAIVEIFFEPSTVFDLAVEEGIAYTVTMATFILTAMLVSDIHEARDKRSVQQIVMTGDNEKYSAAQKKESLENLADALGVEDDPPRTVANPKKK